MALAVMVATDENALICDFAETYHVFDIKALPVELAATLAAGLNDNSRTKRKIAGAKLSLEQMLLARLVDATEFIAWTKTKGAEKGKNRPKSLLKTLLEEKKESIYIGFNDPESLMRKLNEIDKKAGK